jgi:hypothetical protein
MRVGRLGVKSEGPRDAADRNGVRRRLAVCLERLGRRDAAAVVVAELVADWEQASDPVEVADGRAWLARLRHAG